MLVRRRSLEIALSLTIAGMLSSCWCSGPTGPRPEQELVAPAADELPVTGIGGDGLQEGPLASAPSELASPTQTPETFIVRVPAADAIPDPNATPLLEGIPGPTATPLVTPPSPVPGVTQLPATPWPAPTSRPPVAPPGPGAPVITPTPTPATSAEVNITLSASPATASAGHQISVNVVVHAGTGRPVDAVQVYLDFDAAMLEVMSLSGGTALPQELQSSFDNNLGRVDYAAGTLGESVQTPFILVTVDFRAIAGTGPGGTSIAFASLAPPRQTRVAVGAGVDATGDLAPVKIVVQ